MKLEALEQVVQEQLQLGHIEPSTSPWNSPVFIIKKKSGKWIENKTQKTPKVRFLFIHGDEKNRVKKIK